MEVRACMQIEIEGPVSVAREFCLRVRVFHGGFTEDGIVSILLFKLLFISIT